MAARRGCLLRSLLVLVALIVIAVIAATLLPLSPFKPAVEARLSDMLGRKVTIASMRLNYSSGPQLALSGMTIQEAPAFGDGLFLKAENAVADIDLFEYIRTRSVVVKALTIRSAQIQLVKNSQGVWSWSTIGRNAAEPSLASRLEKSEVAGSSIVSMFLAGGPISSKLRNIRIEDASVAVRDRTRTDGLETLYRNISLEAAFSPANPEDSSAGTHIKGELTAKSEGDDEAEVLKATLPFDLITERQTGSGLSVSGSVGPGPFESRNVSVASFTINGHFDSLAGAPMTGSGQLSATDMMVRTINLSQKVAEALRVSQIGDMGEGTGVASLETDFQISRDTVNTNGLRMQQLDGMGDAVAPRGSFKIESALTVDYEATITLSPDATSRVKSASTMLGVLTTIFETNNRVSVPINISGDVRHPRVEVDISRIF